MSRESEIKDALRRIAGTDRTEYTAYLARVKRVDGAQCTVERIQDGMVLEGVRMNASSLKDEGVLLIPKTGSHVLVGSMDGGRWSVMQCSELEGIVINGGKLGGLVKIQELTDKLNRLVNEFNRHTHPFASGAVGPTTMPASVFSKNDYENKDIQQ